MTSNRIVVWCPFLLFWVYGSVKKKQKAGLYVKGNCTAQARLWFSDTGVWGLGERTATFVLSLAGSCRAHLSVRALEVPVKWLGLQLLEKWARNSFCSGLPHFQHDK
jgi:hypothetical protein